MGMRLITGPANSGKAEFALDAVREHLKRRRDPLLIVPRAADRAVYVRELAGSGATLGLRVERFTGLFRLVAARAGITDVPLDLTARDALLANCLSAAGARAATRGMVQLAGEFVAELRRHRITSGRLGAAVRDADWPALELDVVRMYREYCGGLEALGALDREEWSLSVMDALKRRPDLWGTTPVVIYGFDDFTADQLDAIRTLACDVGADLTVTLTYEPGRVALAGRVAAFAELAPLAGEHVALGPRDDYYSEAARAPLGHLERSLFEDGAARVPSAGALELIEGGGQRAELELVAERARALISEGTPAEEIAIVVRRVGPVAEIAREVLEANGVPYALERRVPLRATAIGRAVLGLLGCAAGGAPLEDLLAWLRCPGLIRVRGLLDEFEAAARRAGITDAESAIVEWEARHWPLDAVRDVAAAARRGPGPLAAAVRKQSESLFGKPLHGVGRILDEREMLDVRAAGVIRATLAACGDLAAREARLAPSGPAELAALLEEREVFDGVEPGPGLVTVAEPGELRARRVRALFLTGLQEGEFPEPDGTTRLLSAERLAALAEAGIPPLFVRGEQLDAERYLMYAALSRPTDLLVLCWRSADDDGEAAYRSLFVDDVLDGFSDSPPVSRRPLGWIAGEGAERRTPRFGPEPLRSEEHLAALAARSWSPSSLEGFLACPARWFIERMLKPQEMDPEPDMRATGTVVHEVLQETLERLGDETGDPRPRPAETGRVVELARAALNARADRLAADPIAARVALRELEGHLANYLIGACEQDVALSPRWLELRFGGPEDELSEVDIGHGIRLTGRIDRIDADERGQALIVDYKTSRSVKKPTEWEANGVVQPALYARAAEQLLSVQVIGVLLQPLRAKSDYRPRGLVQEPAPAGLNLVSRDVRSPEAVQELLDEMVDLAVDAAQRARAGLLEATPESCGYRDSGCAYPSICRCGT